MVTEKIKELNATKAKVADLEKAIAAELSRELGGLPTKYGFDSVKSFIKAVKAASGGRSKGKVAKKAGVKKRKRAVITDAIVDEVKRMLAEKISGSKIASAVGISLPSVQNIKTKLGLVKARK
jgi:hypothetical protein